MKPWPTLVATVILLTTVLVGACAAPWASQTLDQSILAPVSTVASSNGARLRPVSPSSLPSLTTDEQVKLSTEEQLARVVTPVRDLRELAMRLLPDVGDIPEIVNSTVPNYEIGDRQEFWAQDMNSGRDFTLIAELRYKTDEVYAWVEVDQPVDLDKLTRHIDRFSTETVPALRDFFGSEWNPGVDNDPRMHILHATGFGNFVAGFYSNGDEYSRLAQPTSNEKEIFYIRLDWLNSLADTSEQYDLVLAHEFQHMIHWHTDMNEETWIGEGLSEFAKDVAGFGPANAFSDGFLRQPDTQLNSWGSSMQGNDTHYGAAYLFMVYFNQRFGSEMTRALVANPANGVDGINEILTTSDAGVTFDDLYADWVVANYVDEPNLLDAHGTDGLYGYRDFDNQRPQVETTHESYPVPPTQGSVHNYGTDYLRLEGEGDLTFHFKGAEVAQLAPLPIASEHYTTWWSNRGDTTDTKLTRRFDLSALAPGTPIEMAATMWWDIEVGYDFLYVLASVDGLKWTPLNGDSSIAETSPLGPGYTGTSNGWHVERFDLSSFAGEEVQVRFEYVTDDAINGRGFFLQNVAIPAIDYVSDFGAGDGWESDGWIYTDNRLRQGWILQVLIFDGDKVVDLQRIDVDEQGNASAQLQGLGNGRTAVIAISGAAPVIHETASYEYWIEP